MRLASCNFIRRFAISCVTHYSPIETMNIDFHYGVIYVVSRLAGMNREQARCVAHACQYVDDATTGGILRFKDGETFERFASAHKVYDYKNILDHEDRKVWVPFHFLPGAEGSTLEEKSVCRPDSKVAREMIRHAIAARAASNALHRLGVSLHVYVDTWAHKGFSGIESAYNKVLTLSVDQQDPATWWGKLKELLHEAAYGLEILALDEIYLLGHGAALHYPDLPWAKWAYTNGHSEVIVRDNLPDYIQAADMACKVVQGYLHGNQHYEDESGLPESSKAALHNLLAHNQNHDCSIRLKVFMSSVASGHVPGIAEKIPAYKAKGVDSWKHAATGIDADDDGPIRPSWSPAFEESDYRRFHDAIKEHRFVVTQEILPAYGIRLV